MRREIIPNPRHADALRAIGFLFDAFFERRAILVDQNDPTRVQHAQLIWADRIVMIYSADDTEFARTAPMRTVAQAGGPTVGLDLIVDDVEAHADRARNAGANIFLQPMDQPYGGRGYSARDPEGNVWSFGRYDPWAAV